MDLQRGYAADYQRFSLFLNADGVTIDRVFFEPYTGLGNS